MQWAGLFRFRLNTTGKHVHPCLALSLYLPNLSLQKFEAIIIAQFDNGPMHKKICAGEYELFNTFDSSQIVSRANSEVLTPGLSVTMAIIIGKYDSKNTNRCPRLGCKSTKFISKESGGKMWYASLTILTSLRSRLTD